MSNPVEALEYIVHYNKPTNQATIHIVGRCGYQREPGHVSDAGNSRWSSVLHDDESAWAHARAWRSDRGRLRGRQPGKAARDSGARVNAR